MLLSDWRVLVRRWYVVLVGLPLTVGLGFLIVMAVPVQYEVQSKILLLPPQQKVSGMPTNPYLNLGGLDGMTDVLSSAMTDAVVQKDLAAAGHAATYEFIRDQTAAGPVALVTVTSNTAADALASQDYLLKKVNPVLIGLQQQVNVPISTYVTETVFTKDARPKVDRKAQIRLLLVVAVVGLGGTYLAAAMIDGLVRSRRRPAVGASQALVPPVSRRPEMSGGAVAGGAPGQTVGPQASRQRGGGDPFSAAENRPPPLAHPSQPAARPSQPAARPSQPAPSSRGAFAAEQPFQQPSNGWPATPANGQDLQDQPNAQNGRDPRAAARGGGRTHRAEQGRGEGALDWLP